MRIRLSRPDRAERGGEKRWPGYLLNGRVRTSTVVLILAFLAVWWAHDTYRTEPTPPAAPQVVPPGFIPDPDYTWVPRTRLQPPETVTETVTPTTTEASPTSATPSPVPGYPFCPPLCPPPTATPPPPPGQAPAPPPSSSAPPGPTTSRPPIP